MSTQWTEIENARRSPGALTSERPVGWRPVRHAVDLVVAGLGILLICIVVALRLHG